MSTRIYTYGLPFGPEDKDLAAVEHQLQSARAYQNHLIRIELDRRGAYRRLRRRYAPEIGKLEEERKALGEEIEKLRDQIKASNAKTRSRNVTAPQRAKLKMLTKRRTEVNKELKERRLAFKSNKEAKAAIDLADERANDMRKAFRADTDTFWGTYLLIEAQVKQAGKKQDPVFRRWDGRGRVGVQIQKGMPVADLFNGDTRVQIDPVPEEAFTGPRGVRRRLSRTRCRIRIGSNGREPIWAEFKMVMHRPLPSDGIIKWAWVRRRKIHDGVPVGSGKSRHYKGVRWRWELQLVVESESFDKRPTVGHGTCAIDIGWRLRDSGDIRVGYFVDDEDREEELLLPKAIIDKLKYANDLRSRDDKSFDDIRAQLIDWLSGRIVPAWLTERLKRLSQWKSKKRLASVVYRWEKHRFGGDEQMFATAWAWLEQHRHIYEWEMGQRSKTLGWRREHYRLIATELCRRYDTIVIEDFDLRGMAKRAKAEEEEELPKAARSQRQMVSLSQFREALSLAASNNGATIVRVPPHHTTTTCWVCENDCSKDERWDPAQHIHHTCSQCRTEWDQDANAAHNMLATYADRKEAA